MPSPERSIDFACRSCREIGVLPILSLGSTPLANSLLEPAQLDQPEPTFPLDLVRCPHCHLVQITETVSAESLFRDYLYFSSFSETMLEHSRSLAERLIGERPLNSDSFVVEIASNDGYLLKNYAAHGVPVLGIEPARNIAQVARERHGIPTRDEFFTADLAEELARDRRANIIHANNVLAHVPDLNGFVAGIRRLLADDGLAVVEVPYLLDFIDHLEFDTIYHEHLCYFSLHALDSLFARHGLTIARVERLPIHGGSLRIFAGSRTPPSRPEVDQLLQHERKWGIEKPEPYQRFRDGVEDILRTLRQTLTEFKNAGKSIAIYGASAKGSTLLNTLKMPAGTFDFVVDRSSIKQGRYTPGTHLPIVPPERLLEAMPDYALLLTWNFADEILRQQSAYRAAGGRFLVPLPEVKVIG